MSTDEQEADVALWLRWKQVSEIVRTAVVSQVAAASALPEGELTVLVQLDHAGGVLRQNAIAALTGWDRSRLSHVLTRMEREGLVARTKLRNGVDVTIEPAGIDALEGSRMPLRDAVRAHLTGRLDAEDRVAFERVLGKLGHAAG